MKRILIVDDDVNILNTISEAFQDTDYKVITAESGPLALEILKAGEINLVISDMIMPQMDGYELLSEIKAQYPQVIRLIMSTNVEEAYVFKAILHNIAKFNIAKPIQRKTLLESVDQIFETEDSLKSSDLLLLINNIDQLPTIETNYQKILNMIAKDADTRAIAAEIEKDFAISSKLLQTVNSAYYGIQTGSVKHATVYLGLQNLKSLVYSIAIMNTFNSVSERDQHSIRDLWDHALMTSKLVHYIYEVFIGRRLPESAYSAGLLHNIGSLILIQNHMQDYVGMMNNARKKSSNLLDLEKEAYHVTHQEAGGYLISWWELPFPIVESALFHHRPLDPGIINREIVCAVHLAQHYAYQLAKQPVVTEFFPEVFDILGIQESKFEAAVSWNNWR